jgi:hypothetical protein
MHGEDHGQQSVFSYVSLEQRVPAEHSLRAVRKVVDEIFRAMSKQFDGLYSATGRPSIPPERLTGRSVAEEICPVSPKSTNILDARYGLMMDLILEGV